MVLLLVHWVRRAVCAPVALMQKETGCVLMLPHADDSWYTIKEVGKQSWLLSSHHLAQVLLSR